MHFRSFANILKTTMERDSGLQAIRVLEGFPDE